MSDTNFHRAIKPLLMYGRIMGLITFKFAKNQYEKSKINAVLNIGLVIVYIVFLVITTRNKMIQLQPENESDSLSFTVDFMVTISAACQTVIAWMCSSFNQSKYIELINKIKSIDQDFRKLGVWIFYENVWKQILTVTVLRVLFILIVCGVQVFGFESDYKNYCWYISLIVSTAICHQAVFFVQLLKKRFSILNEHLQELQKINDVVGIDDEKNIKLPTVLGTKLSVLRIICPIHHELTKIAKCINSIYGVTLLFTFGVSFITLTVYLYYISVLLGGIDENKVTYIITALFVLLYYVIETVILCHICKTTVEEAEKAGTLLHKIDCNDDDLKDQVEMFSLQIAHAKLEFTAAGFFPINYTLCFSIIGGVTTYLVILIQLASSNANTKPKAVQTQQN